MHANTIYIYTYVNYTYMRIYFICLCVYENCALKCGLCEHMIVSKASV